MRATNEQIADWWLWVTNTPPTVRGTVALILAAFERERELYDALSVNWERLMTEYMGYRQDANTTIDYLHRRDAWPYTTPTGHVYGHPQDIDGIKRLLQTQMVADLEDWGEAECPPGPTWNMVSDVLEALRQAELRSQA